MIKQVLKDRRGYMLVEIILASVIAFGVAAYIVNLTIKLKNKNDDMLVETQVATDQAIITNKLMTYAKADGTDFVCSNIEVLDGKKITYKGNFIDVLNKYTDVSNINCDNSDGKINVKIGLSVMNHEGKDYDVSINYRYDNFADTVTTLQTPSQNEPESNPDGTYTITFVTGDNNVHCDQITGIKKGDELTELCSVSRNGYIFLGWYTKPTDFNNTNECADHKNCTGFNYEYYHGNPDYQDDVKFKEIGLGYSPLLNYWVTTGIPTGMISADTNVNTGTNWKYTYNFDSDITLYAQWGRASISNGGLNNCLWTCTGSIDAEAGNVCTGNGWLRFCLN